MQIATTTTKGCDWEVLSSGSLIFTYCDDTGSLDQWRAYFRMIQSLKVRSTLRFLIYCSTVPSREALGMIADAARGQSWQVALISPSTAVRFAASTFSMIAKGFRFFSPERLVEAFQHLQCSPAEQQQARRALARVRVIASASLKPSS